MNFATTQTPARHVSAPHGVGWLALALGATLLTGFIVANAAEAKAEEHWRQLPLVTAGKVDTNWVHLGWGRFVVEDGTLRTECDPRGLGLLVYRKERLGNCQIRVVFKPKEVKSNSGVRAHRRRHPRPDKPSRRGVCAGCPRLAPTAESMRAMQASAAREEGPWFAVHRGYEVQIAGGGDPLHGTGSIYSLADSSGIATQAGQWRTMIITLSGDEITVELDGKHATTFDSSAANLPPQKEA